MARPVKSTKKKLIQRNIGMDANQWNTVEEKAKEKGWTVSRYIRAVTVNHALGNFIKRSDVEEYQKECKGLLNQLSEHLHKELK